VHDEQPPTRERRAPSHLRRCTLAQVLGLGLSNLIRAGLRTLIIMRAVLPVLASPPIQELYTDPWGCAPRRQYVSGAHKGRRGRYTGRRLRVGIMGGTAGAAFGLTALAAWVVCCIVVPACIHSATDNHPCRAVHEALVAAVFPADTTCTWMRGGAAQRGLRVYTQWAKGCPPP
jgi:hypothetical protein